MNQLQRAGNSFVVTCFLGMAAIAAHVMEAQTVIGNPRLGSSVISNSTGDNIPRARSAPMALSDINSVLSRGGPIVRWGSFDVRPHISHTLSYGNGLLNPTQAERQSSIINTTVAGVLLEAGKYLTAHYTGTINEYSNRYVTDSIDHEATISGAFGKGDWNFGASQSYSINSPILVETGQQTRQTLYSSNGNVGYQIGKRSLLEMRISRNIRLANSDVQTSQWTTSDWYSWVGAVSLRYQFSLLFETSAGIEFTHDEITDSPDMRAAQPYLQLVWRPRPRISATFRAGAERRSVEGDSTELSNPVYAGSLQYQIFDTTAITFSATQAVSASFFANLASKTSSRAVHISQRLLGHLYLVAGYSVGETRYIATALSIVDGRDDKYETYHVRISTPLLTRGTIAAFAQHTDNSSNTREFDFTSEQIGLEVGYRF
jgi:hypothetical protein